MTRTYHGTDGNNVKAATQSGVWPFKYWERWRMYGYDGADILTGGPMSDRIDGGAGIDRMMGLAGGDVYIVDNIHDTVIEDVDNGYDTIASSVSYSLSANVESLSLTGDAAINGYGNELDNYIIGNNKNNTLNGRAGDDHILGRQGDDVLDGGSGADTLRGGQGDDIFVVDQIGDSVIEWENEGIDTVQTLRNFYFLPNHVENLTMRAVATVTHGYGNTLNNVMKGNLQDNFIRGFGGHDYIQGNYGSDRLFGDAGSDHLIGLHRTSNNEFDELTGGEGADVFQLYNQVGTTAYTYNDTSYAIIEDFSAFQQDRVWVFGSRSDYSLDKTQGDYLGNGGGTDTLIKQGSNIIGVMSNTTGVNLDNHFTFIGG